jgi:hypothetical protein
MKADGPLFSLKPAASLAGGVARLEKPLYATQGDAVLHVVSPWEGAAMLAAV